MVGFEHVSYVSVHGLSSLLVLKGFWLGLLLSFANLCVLPEVLSQWEEGIRGPRVGQSHPAPFGSNMYSLCIILRASSFHSFS